MNAPMPYTEMATAGAFTTDQVARLLGVETKEVRSWLQGQAPLILSDYEPVEHRRLLSFEGLIEARVIAYLLESGLGRPRLRGLMQHLRAKTEQRHPLARRDAISTTGDRVFEKDGERFVNLLNDCYADAVLLRPALRGHVAYDGARALYLEPDPKVFPLVRIDPRRAFGRPVVVEGAVAVPTATLAEAATHEGQSGAADWYGVSAEAVRQAVDFEKHSAAA
ncbi:hypothetical protein [Phenylobacterium sp.]|uniref:hypothetical protein n=1 Tax=Phenylobacterium sp. TaxID=1871053 RepID=UPI0035AE4A05